MFFTRASVLATFFAVLAVGNFCQFAIADDDTFNDRTRLVNRRNERFYKVDITRHFVSLSGEYDSDEDSKQYVVKFDHFYKNRRIISDIDLRMETLFENESSKKKFRSKESDLYQAIIAEKIILFDTQNYAVFFNETRYDNEADSSYYDMATAAGVGRMFFNDSLELDLAYGKAKAKDVNSVSHHATTRRFDYDRDIWVPAFRTEFSLFDDVRVVSRGYAYFSGDIDSYYLNTRLQYPLTRRVYLQLSHIFDKRTYEKYDSKNYNVGVRKVNETRRQLLLGFRYDFGRAN